MAIAIEVKNLTKYFGKLSAVDNISFQVREGEFFGFLGPNGAGKTTTIRMLTGIISPSSGEISIMGYNLPKDILKAREIMGIVPEVSNAYVDLSAWDNMMFQGELYGLSRKKCSEVSSKLLKNFGLYERRNQLVKFFSKGMKQRLLISLALLNNPEILFLDEPTGGLDVKSAIMIREKLRLINKDGTTIFLTTHNMEEANKLCERVAIINHGKISAIDTPEKLKLTIEKLRKIIVSFDREFEIQALSSIPMIASFRELGDKIELQTSSPGKLIPYIVDFSREKKLNIVNLNVVTPSLEDVFINLTEGKKKIES